MIYALPLSKSNTVVSKSITCFRRRGAVWPYDLEIGPRYEENLKG